MSTRHSKLKNPEPRQLAEESDDEAPEEVTLDTGKVSEGCVRSLREYVCKQRA